MATSEASPIGNPTLGLTAREPHATPYLENALEPHQAQALLCFSSIARPFLFNPQGATPDAVKQELQQACERTLQSWDRQPINRGRDFPDFSLSDVLEMARREVANREALSDNTPPYERALTTSYAKVRDALSELVQQESAEKEQKK